MLLAAAACTSNNNNNDDEVTPTPNAASQTPSDGTSAEGAAPVPDGTPTATVRWADNSQTFVLVLCDSANPCSLAASGGEVADGTILTIDATNGSGDTPIAEDATLDESFLGTVEKFTLADSGTFEGSGTYQAGGAAGDFELSGDCRDLQARRLTASAAC